jgi:lysophospholipase L1-like esterase
MAPFDTPGEHGMNRGIGLLAGALALLPIPAAAAEPPWHFGTKALHAVEPDTLYNSARGYGFEPSRDGQAAGAPLEFSVTVPEGDYRVTVTLRGPSNTTVRAETRRLMCDHVAVRRGLARCSFTVNVRNAFLPPPPPNAPGASEVRLYPRELQTLTWDDKLTLSFSGHARLAAIDIEPATVPRLFLLGDSTVTDQPKPPASSWGQVLPCFFASDIAVANYAESGETLKSFLAELRLDKVLSQMKPGDWALIQFGHNDEKSQWPQTYAPPDSTYRLYLRAYIAEIRRLGGHPVLVTSVERRNFDSSGHIVASHGGYPDAVRAVAAEEGVPLIDLNAMSTAFYEALGPERAALAFMPDDMTHQNGYGGYELARAVAQAIKDTVPGLAEHLKPDLPRFDPHTPDRPQDVAP